MWSELPLAFQQCIKIVRALGIRFLWIDSLCIVQDDPDEWQLEAARMASIFENAEVTIAMHQVGPSKTALPQLLHAFSLPYDTGGNAPDSIQFHLVDLGRPTTPQKAVDFSKLSTRGWCFQVGPTRHL